MIETFTEWFTARTTDGSPIPRWFYCSKMVLLLTDGFYCSRELCAGSFIHGTVVLIVLLMVVLLTDGFTGGCTADILEVSDPYL